jgi:hypothetical protein
LRVLTIKSNSYVVDSIKNENYIDQYRRSTFHQTNKKEQYIMKKTITIKYEFTSGQNMSGYSNAGKASESDEFAKLEEQFEELAKRFNVTKVVMKKVD